MRMDGIYRRRSLEEWEGRLYESVESGDGSVDGVRAVNAGCLAPRSSSWEECC